MLHSTGYGRLCYHVSNYRTPRPLRNNEFHAGLMALWRQ